MQDSKDSAAYLGIQTCRSLDPGGVIESTVLIPKLRPAAHMSGQAYAKPQQSSGLTPAQDGNTSCRYVTHTNSRLWSWRICTVTVGQLILAMYTTLHRRLEPQPMQVVQRRDGMFPHLSRKPGLMDLSWNELERVGMSNTSVLISSLH